MAARGLAQKAYACLPARKRGKVEPARAGGEEGKRRVAGTYMNWILLLYRCDHECDRLACACWHATLQDCRYVVGEGQVKVVMLITLTDGPRTW